MATRCGGGGLKHQSKVGPFRKNWVRVNWINDRIGFLQITCTIMLNYIVDKDKNLEYVRLFDLYGAFILYKLTRLFWSNTCLGSMCITGARGAANKQV